MKKFGLKLLVACILSFAVVGCGSDSSDNSTSNNSSTSDTQTNLTPSATVSGGNISVYGNVDKTKFSEVKLDNGNAVLTLDDTDTNSNYAGLGLDLSTVSQQNSTVSPQTKNYYYASSSASEITIAPSIELKETSTDYLDKITKLLQNNGATVNVLVNQTTINSQSSVIQITLDVNFTQSQKSANELRNLIATELNGNKLPQGISVSGTEYANKLRVNLSFWQDKDKIFLWLGSYLEKDSEVVKVKYYDLNSATALTSTASSVNIMTNAGESFQQSNANTGGIDILWSIDASGSMTEEQTNLANGASQFFNTLNQAGVDYRLAVNTHGYDCTQLRKTSTNAEFIDNNTPNALEEWRKLARPGSTDSGTETGFYCVREANLTNFDRPTAKNLVVFVSDEPENETFYKYRPASVGYSSGYTVRDFNDYKQYFSNTGATYFSIVGTSPLIRPTFSDSVNGWSSPDFQCNGQGGSASGGGHFKEIAKITGGSSASICADASDWSVMFEQILKTATGLASNFKLKYVPLPSTVKVTINGNTVQRDITHQNGFDLVYGQQDVSLVFYGNSLPKANDTIQVSYDYFAGSR